MNRLSSLILVASAATAIGGGCAQHRYRPEQRVERDRAGEAVLRIMWRKQLVADKLLGFEPQEWAVAAIAPDGSFFVGSTAKQFLCFEKDGTRRWKVDLDGPVSSEPLYDEASKTIYLGADDGKLYAIDVTTGETRWVYATRGVIVPRPALSQGLLLFSTGEDRVYALDAESGEWRWQYDREKPEGFTIHGYSGVFAHDGVAFVGFSDGHLVAIKASSGEPIWERSLRGGAQRFFDVDATPVLVEGVLLTSSYSSGVYGVDPASGSVAWHLPIEGASSVVHIRKRLYFTAPRVGLVAIDTSGQGLWRQAIEDGIPSRPVAIGDYLLVTGTETGMFIVAADDGRLLQYFRPGNGISAVPAVSRAHVAVLTNQGRFYAFEQR